MFTFFFLSLFSSFARSNLRLFDVEDREPVHLFIAGARLSFAFLSPSLSDPDPFVRRWRVFSIADPGIAYVTDELDFAEEEGLVEDEELRRRH